MWKDFLYFTKTERQGIIVLVVLIIGLFFAPKFFQFFTKPEETSPVEKEKFEKEYETFISSLTEMKKEKKFHENTPLPYQEREIKLCKFDPNTADSMTFLSLGLSSWMTRNILNYRRKQGKFRRPEDFRKIYELTEEQYRTLLPYIQITENFHSQDTTIQLLAEQRVQRDTIFKYQPGTIVNLNQADTTELKKIPGIGSGIAHKITNRRRQLGGFYRIEQLQEIELKAELLRPWFVIDASLIQRININKASIERMMHHPYINFYQAKDIVEYRKKKGKLKSLKQLALYEEFTSVDFERIEPYICYD